MFGTNTSFGNSSFGTSFGATQALGAFGSVTQTPQPTVPVGTTIRFVALSGTDTVQKTGANAGGPSQITTRHQNISAMKEYETKSVEELRLEDYMANRKVGQPQTSFISTPFSGMQPTTSQQGTSMFGSTPHSTSNLFGSSATPTQNTNIFGQQKTGFDMNSSSNIFNNSLNKPTTAVSSSPFTIGNQFNTNTSTTGSQSGFTSLFNNNNQTNTTPFGQTAVNSPFKTNNIFTPQTGLTSDKSVFSLQGSSSNMFNLGTTTLTNTLTANTTTTTTPLFANTTTTSTSNPFSNNTLGFQNNQPQSSFISTPFSGMQPTTSQPGTSIFGSTPQSSSNLFGSTTTPNQSTNIFGQPKTGFDMNSSSNIFNTSLNKPSTAVSSSPFTIGTQFNTSTSTTGAQSGFTSLFNNNNQANTTPFGQTAVNSPFKTNNIFTPQTTLNTDKSIFSLQSSSSNMFNLGTTTLTNTLSANTTTTTTPLFANTTTTSTSNPFSNNTLSFQNNQSSSLFGANPLPNIQNNTLQQSLPVGNVQQTPQNSDLLLNRLKTLPYGETSLFLNDTPGSSPGLGSLKFTTDPKTINQYKIKAKTDVKLNKPASSEKTRNNSVLFDGLDDNTSDDLRCAIDVFVPKKNIKKLDLKPSSYLSEGDADHSSNVTSFERTRSSIYQVSEREARLENSTPVRHVRYADNTYPGERTPSDFGSSSAQAANLSSISSEIPTFLNSSYNRSNNTAHSHNNSSSPSRSYSNSKTGVINTRPDYRIKPSFEEIEKRYNPETCSCVVNSFLIERPNYGSILFENPLDLKGLNLDEIVHIRRKEVVVYPDDDNKPPIGQGLNRPAIITLHQVWPIDKSNNEVIKDVDRLNLMKYPEKIESATVEKGARFIEYRPETGSWVFAVKHFSKYGITDDDEELVQNVATAVHNQSQRSLQPPNIVQHVPSQQQNTSNQSPVNGLLMNRLKTSPYPCSHEPVTFSVNTKSQQTVTDLSLNNGKSQSFQEPKPVSNYRMSARTSVKFANTPQASLEKSKPDHSIMLDSFEEAANYSMRTAIDELSDNEEFEDEKNASGRRSLTVHGTKRLALQNVSPNVSMISYEKPIILGAAVPRQQKIRQICLKPDLYAAKKKLSRDIMSVCVSGSAKVRFFNGSRKFCYIQGDTIMVNELKLIPTLSNGLLVETLEKKLESFLENDSTVTSLNMTPTLAPYIETASFITDASSHDLLHALYGELSSKTPYSKQDERVTRVINWLASINKTLTPPTNLYKLIIYHMSCDRYDLASKLALENGHPRLALLISTLNINQELVLRQLDSWRTSKADMYVDSELLKIYILISGKTEWKLSNDKTIYCVKGLKWTQQMFLFALHLNPSSSRPRSYGFHMLPLYIERLDTDTNDVDYHILARHSPENIISASDDLVSEWFLLESLKSFRVISLSESECMNSDIIHCNLAAQLAPIDLRWGCFVALHITNNEVRNQVLVKCLEQNQCQLEVERRDNLTSLNLPEAPTSSSNTVESWLIEKLKVPIEFIGNAKAIAVN